MITAIRPYTPQVRQNQPNFQRKFEADELKGVVEGCDVTLNDVQFFIGAKHIKAIDGADKQIEKLVQDNPDNEWVQHIARIFYKHNPKK